MATVYVSSALIVHVIVSVLTFQNLSSNNVYTRLFESLVNGCKEIRKKFLFFFFFFNFY